MSQAAAWLVERFEAKQPGQMNFLKRQGPGNKARIVSLSIQRAELSPETGPLSIGT